MGIGLTIPGHRIRLHDFFFICLDKMSSEPVFTGNIPVQKILAILTNILRFMKFHRSWMSESIIRSCFGSYLRWHLEGIPKRIFFRARLLYDISGVTRILLKTWTNLIGWIFTDTQNLLVMSVMASTFFQSTTWVEKTSKGTGKIRAKWELHHVAEFPWHFSSISSPKLIKLLTRRSRADMERLKNSDVCICS